MLDCWDTQLSVGFARERASQAKKHSFSSPSFDLQQRKTWLSRVYHVLIHKGMIVIE
jgi:hypothetical protein